MEVVAAVGGALLIASFGRLYDKFVRKKKVQAQLLIRENIRPDIHAASDDFKRTNSEEEIWFEARDLINDTEVSFEKYAPEALQPKRKIRRRRAASTSRNEGKNFPPSLFTAEKGSAIQKRLRDEKRTLERLGIDFGGERSGRSYDATRLPTYYGEDFGGERSGRSYDATRLRTYYDVDLGGERSTRYGAPLMLGACFPSGRRQSTAPPPISVSNRHDTTTLPTTSVSDPHHTTTLPTSSLSGPHVLGRDEETQTLNLLGAIEPTDAAGGEIVHDDTITLPTAYVPYPHDTTTLPTASVSDPHDTTTLPLTFASDPHDTTTLPTTSLSDPHVLGRDEYTHAILNLSVATEPADAAGVEVVSDTTTLPTASLSDTHVLGRDEYTQTLLNLSVATEPTDVAGGEGVSVIPIQSMGGLMRMTTLAQKLGNFLCLYHVQAILESVFVLTNLVLEILSAIFDQLSSKEKPQYALIGLAMSLVMLLICSLEVVYKIRKEGAVWKRYWFYLPSPSNKPLGTFADNFGLLCAALQCVTSTVQYGFHSHHADYPINFSIFVVALAVCLVYLQFTKGTDRYRNVNDQHRSV